MYRIELAPGEVTVFRTIEELATGVRNGVITARARIYHNASQKWLPIEFHPHYKLALELLAGRTIDVPTQKPAEGPRFDNIVTPSVSSSSAPSSPGGNLPFIAVDDDPPADEPVAPPAATSRFAPPHVASHARPLPWAAQRSAPTVAAEPVRHDSSYAPQVEIEPVRVARDYEPTPQVAPPAPAAAPFTLPSATASPVLDLPRISYPEFTPAEAPVSEQPSPTSRGRRSVHLAGAVAVLVVGAYAARLAFSPASPTRASAVAVEVPVRMVADRPALPVAGPAVSDAGPPSPAGARSRVVATPAPASSGFARALEPRAIVSAPVPSDKSIASAPTPSDSAIVSITPEPIDVDLSLPALPTSDSLLPSSRQRGDSAMKRILKAVGGGTESSIHP